RRIRRREVGIAEPQVERTDRDAIAMRQGCIRDALAVEECAGAGTQVANARPAIDKLDHAMMSADVRVGEHDGVVGGAADRQRLVFNLQTRDFSNLADLKTRHRWESSFP